MKKDNKEILVSNSLQTFFFDELLAANKKSTTPLNNEMIYYSSKVMDKYSDTSKLFEEVEGKLTDKVLGIKYLESSQFPISKKKKEIKDIADTTLFLCGFFSDSLERKLINIEYYINLGIMSYKRLDSLVPSYLDMPFFFNNLADSFHHIINTMAMVAHGMNVQHDVVTLFIDHNKLKAS